MTVHCVTDPQNPFSTGNGLLTVHQVCAWQDNFSWLIVCEETGEAAVVDGPEAKPVLEYCEAHSFTLTTVLNTHTHRDHIGINIDLGSLGILDDLTVVGSASRSNDIPGLSLAVSEGDIVSFGGVDGKVMLTEGHIDGHISFVFDDVLFCGDTLFGAGCGYLFDGPPSKMQRSLERLSSLPGQTRVCCAHEYTQDNLRFAWSVDQENVQLRYRINKAWEARAQGRSTVPSTIDLERKTNPFLRWDSPSIKAAALQLNPTLDITDPVETFAAIRRLKDSKRYREISDEMLPIGLP